jgi:hypothetical protein
MEKIAEKIENQFAYLFCKSKSKADETDKILIRRWWVSGIECEIEKSENEKITHLDFSERKKLINVSVFTWIFYEKNSIIKPQNSNSLSQFFHRKISNSLKTFSYWTQFKI